MTVDDELVSTGIRGLNRLLIAILELCQLWGSAIIRADGRAGGD